MCEHEVRPSPGRIVVGFGANLGDRLGTMRAALRELSREAEVVATSRVYESPPFGGMPQPPYLNAAALLREPASLPDAAFVLLDALLAIEARLGRVRRERWGPRTLDLDILWIDGVRVDAPRLVVPHPYLRERAFALAPLLDLVPDARDPLTGEAYVIPPGDLRATGDSLA
jgi:2-amino-4-hydroxy-6-hydroxymethyldihydropteridine diphosphokinase